MEKTNFDSARIRNWKKQPLEPSFQRTIEHIEIYGCDVTHVKGDDVAPAFSYTVGVFDLTGQPEIIQVGLKMETAHYALNETVMRLRTGLLEMNQRESEIVGQVDCIFRPAEERWMQRLMYRAQWYYRDQPFPALQCVYPDLENRFPWEEGFDVRWRRRQALLFEGAAWTDVEEDLWAANDPDGPKTDWKWPDPPDTMAYVREAIAENLEPVTDVYHDADDGAGQFHGVRRDGKPKLLCLHHLVDRDATIDELADLPRGWRAWRDAVGERWTREPNVPEAEDPDES